MLPGLGGPPLFVGLGPGTAAAPRRLRGAADAPRRHGRAVAAPRDRGAEATPRTHSSKRGRRSTCHTGKLIGRGMGSSFRRRHTRRPYSYVSTGTMGDQRSIQYPQSTGVPAGGGRDLRHMIFLLVVQDATKASLDTYQARSLLHEAEGQNKRLIAISGGWVFLRTVTTCSQIPSCGRSPRLENRNDDARVGPINIGPTCFEPVEDV